MSAPLSTSRLATRHADEEIAARSGVWPSRAQPLIDAPWSRRNRATHSLFARQATCLAWVHGCVGWYVPLWMYTPCTRNLSHTTRSPLPAYVASWCTRMLIDIRAGSGCRRDLGYRRRANGCQVCRCARAGPPGLPYCLHYSHRHTMTRLASWVYASCGCAYRTRSTMRAVGSCGTREQPSRRGIATAVASMMNDDQNLKFVGSSIDM